MFYSPALGIDNTAMPLQHPRWKEEEGQRRIPSFFFSFPILDFSEQIVQRCCSILWKLLLLKIHTKDDSLNRGRFGPLVSFWYGETVFWGALVFSKKFWKVSSATQGPHDLQPAVWCDVSRSGAQNWLNCDLLRFPASPRQPALPDPVQHRPLDSLVILHGGDISHICIFMNLSIFLHGGDKYTNI